MYLKVYLDIHGVQEYMDLYLDIPGVHELEYMDSIPGYTWKYRWWKYESVPGYTWSTKGREYIYFCHVPPGD